VTRGQLPERAGSLGLTVVGLPPRYPPTEGIKKQQIIIIIILLLLTTTMWLVGDKPHSNITNTL